MYCSSCGKQNPEGAAFCAFCGKKMTAPQEESQTFIEGELLVPDQESHQAPPPAISPICGPTPPAGHSHGGQPGPACPAQRDAQGPQRSGGATAGPGSAGAARPGRRQRRPPGTVLLQKRFSPAGGAFSGYRRPTGDGGPPRRRRGPGHDPPRRRQGCRRPCGAGAQVPGAAPEKGGLGSTQHPGAQAPQAPGGRPVL